MNSAHLLTSRILFVLVPVMRRDGSIAGPLTEEAKQYAQTFTLEALRKSIAFRLIMRSHPLCGLPYGARRLNDHRGSRYILHAHISDPRSQATLVPFAPCNSVARRMDGNFWRTVNRAPSIIKYVTHMVHPGSQQSTHQISARMLLTGDSRASISAGLSAAQAFDAYTGHLQGLDATLTPPYPQ